MHEAMHENTANSPRAHIPGKPHFNRRVAAHHIDNFSVAASAYDALTIGDAFWNLQKIAHILRVAFDAEEPLDDDAKAGFSNLAGGLARGIDSLQIAVGGRLDTLADDIDNLNAALAQANIRAMAFEAACRYHDAETRKAGVIFDRVDPVTGAILDAAGPDLSEPADADDIANAG